MELVGDILQWILFACMAVVFARIIISWLPVSWPRGIRPFVVFIYDITEPLLSPLRRVIPVINMGGGAALDLSPTALLFVLIFLRWLVGRVFG